MTAALLSGVSDVISDLRDRISALGGGEARRARSLAFGVPDIDAVLPGGGLAYGAAAALFVAGIAARTKGLVVCCRLNLTDGMAILVCPTDRAGIAFARASVRRLFPLYFRGIARRLTLVLKRRV